MPPGTGVEARSERCSSSMENDGGSSVPFATRRNDSGELASPKPLRQGLHRRIGIVCIGDGLPASIGLLGVDRQILSFVRHGLLGLRVSHGHGISTLRINHVTTLGSHHLRELESHRKIGIGKIRRQRRFNGCLPIQYPGPGV